MDEPLPLMPPRSVTGGAEVHGAWPSTDDWTFVGAEVENVAKPDRLNPFDIPVDGYTLVNVSAGWRGEWMGREAGVDLQGAQRRQHLVQGLPQPLQGVRPEPGAGRRAAGAHGVLSGPGAPAGRPVLVRPATPYISFSSPTLRAKRTSSERWFSPSLSMIRERYVSTVLGLMNSFLPISREL